MSVARARILDLMKVQCKVFSTTFNPEGIRMGNKILRQRLRGPALASYYPRRIVTIKDLQREFPDFTIINEEEEDRLEHLAGLRARGKGNAKKNAAADKKKKR
ncbi:MAG: mitochondral 37S ribosomal protein S27 [Sporothrix epigloea]